MAQPTQAVSSPSPWWARADPVLVGALLGALVIRVAWCVVAARTPTSFGDPFSYLTHAEDLARGKGYVTFFYAQPTAYYPVGYPAVLGGLLWLARLAAPGTTPMQVAIGLNLVCGTATVGVVFAIARHLAGNRAARIAAVVVAVFPSLILYTATAYLETVFCFLVTVIAWLLVGWSAPRRTSAVDATAGATIEIAPDDGSGAGSATRSWSPRRADLVIPPWPGIVTLGIVFAAATMIRPITLAFLPVLVLAWGFGRPGWLRSLGAVVIVAGIVALVAVPWSIRSSEALGGTVFIATNTGDNLCIGHSPESSGEYIDLNDLCGAGYDDVPDGEREAERNRRGTERALAFARSHPAREVKLLARKAFHLVAHDHEGVDAVESYGADPFLGDTARTTLRMLADGWYDVVGVLAIVGAITIAWRGDGRARLVLAWAITLLVVPLVFFGGARFHLPALPFAAVFAALAADLAWRRITNGSPPRPSG